MHVVDPEIFAIPYLTGYDTVLLDPRSRLDASYPLVSQMTPCVDFAADFATLITVGCPVDFLPAFSGRHNFRYAEPIEAFEQALMARRFSPSLHTIRDFPVLLWMSCCED